MTPLIHGMVQSIRLWYHLLMGWSTPSGSDATQSWDGLLHPALTPLNPGMVYSIRLWRHSILGWFTPFGSDATQSWDGLLYPALTPFNLDMVHSIRLWRHSIQGWFTPSGSDATQSWDMVYSIRFWHHSILGWFTPSGSDATKSWDDLHHPAFTPLTLDDSLHPSLTPRTNVYLGMDRWPHPVLTSLTWYDWPHPAIITDILQVHVIVLYNNYLPPPSNHQHFQWYSHVANLDCMVYPSQFAILFRHALFNIQVHQSPLLHPCFRVVFTSTFKAETPSLHQAWFTNTSLLQSSHLPGCGPLHAVSSSYRICAQFVGLLY